jgi:uncharacterized protein (DUF4415 family)
MQNKSVKISRKTREAYERRRQELERAEKQDADAPMLPIEKWERGTIGKFYRPLKTPVSVRIDNDVLAWLKSKGEGHLTRINDILRERMLKETRRSGQV